MSTPSDREKLFEKLLKEWENIEDEALVREVATKGKYINFAQQFLAKRQNKPITDISDYFYVEVDKYVHRLLNNRQVHKAALVLRNVGREPQTIFYEFVQSTSKEHIDDDIKEHVLEYLQKSNKDFEVDRDEYDYYLLVLRLAASKDSLHRLFESEIHIFTLEALYRLSMEFRKRLAVTTCLKCENAILVEKLDKHATWDYLWKNDEIQLIGVWLNELYWTYIKAMGESPEGDDIIKEPCFDVALKNQFSSWDIEEEMFAAVQSHPKISEEFLIHNFARLGMFIDSEKDSIVMIFKRIFQTDSFKLNEKWLMTEENLAKLLRAVLEKKEFLLLCYDEPFSVELIEKVADEFPDLKRDIDLCVAIRKCDLNVPEQIAELSEKCSQFLIETHDKNFYENHPSIYLLEKLLRDTPMEELVNDEQARTILKGKPFINALLTKLREKDTIHDCETTLDDLLKLINIDISVIRKDAGLKEGELISFDNEILIKKYGSPTKLTYVDYIKMHRSSYAVYQFFLDQLRTYSQISKAQIEIACGVVAELAINHFDDDDIYVHCVSFSEQLGVNSQKLRAYLMCCRAIKQHYGDKFVMEDVLDDDRLLVVTEKVFLEQIHNSDNPSEEIMHTTKYYPMRVLCNAKKRDLPVSLLKEAANKTDWFRFILFATYHKYSIRSIVNVCKMKDGFPNPNVGNNIARALREMLIEEETPLSERRKSSFSFREHKRKMQSRAENKEFLNDPSKAMSISMSSSLNRLKSSSQFLSINEEQDIFAIILLSTVDNPQPHPPVVDLAMLRELMRNYDKSQAATHLNLLRFGFKLKRPFCAMLAAVIWKPATEHCWLAWLMIAIGIETIPNNIKAYDELAKYIITYAVKDNHPITLNLSFGIFYPESKFALFTKFLCETRHFNFSTETSAYLMDCMYELNENNVMINSLMKWTKEEILSLILTLLAEHIKVGFASREHEQNLLDAIAASGISQYAGLVDFNTIAAVNKIILFTKVHLNFDELISNIAKPPEAEDDSNLDDWETEQSVNVQNEYNRVCDALIAEKEFTVAIELANLLNLSKDTIIYEKWVHIHETEEIFDYDQCDTEIEENSISPMVPINFLLFITGKLDDDDLKKYSLLKRILNLIKKHHLYPNEGVNRDKVEYEMYKCLLQNDTSTEDIEIYFSEYYETIMAAERGVLYKPFLDLKDLSGVDDLTVVHKEALKKSECDRLDELMNKLMEEGDIVQALRLQGIFNHRTVDLHYLVFCMALAEGLASLRELSIEQKQILSEGLKHAASKFNKRTLRLIRCPSTSCSTSVSSSPATNRTFLENVESTRLDFEEIPAGEKQDILEAIQSLASRIKSGFKLAQRVVMAFRTAMYLDKEYLDVLQTKDPYELLQNAMNDPCLNRLLVMNDIMTSMQMRPVEIASFMAEQIARAIIKSRFYLFQSSSSSNFGQNFLWEYDLDKDFHLFLELCPETSTLGHCLLRYCDVLKIYRQYDSMKNAEPDFTGQHNAKEMSEIFNNLRTIMENQVLSHKKQNTITVELLIKANDCFMHECSMEGIVYVLQRCRALTSVLTAAKSWHLIAKLLMGVAHYRDMYYCFETLIQNDQFESLLGQFDGDRARGYKQAVIQYLREHHPDDKENFRLAALHFHMYEEVAKMKESEAYAIIDDAIKDCEVETVNDKLLEKVNKSKPSTSSDPGPSTSNDRLNAAFAAGVTFLDCSKTLLDTLNKAMETYASAAENYLFENVLGKAAKAAHTAEMVAMQIHLVRDALNDVKPYCVCVVRIRSETAFRYLVNNEFNIPQCLIVSRNYPTYDIIWTEAIFNQFVLQGKEQFFIDYCIRMELTDAMIEHLVKTFLKYQLTNPVTAKINQAISEIIEHVESVTLRYRLASLVGDKRILSNMLNGDCLAYLQDTDYGRNEKL